MADNAVKVDGNVRHWYVLRAIERWLSIRLELLGSAVSLLAASIAVASAASGFSSASAGLIGLSLSFAFSITGLLNGTVRSFSELEAGMNSVERITFYATEIPQEAPKRNAFTPPKGWPHSGAVDITNLRMRYRPTTPLVIKGVTMSIKGGERVGVVGRTGSGKSSLMLCLMRLVEPERESKDSDGPILFDGVDTTKVHCNVYCWWFSRYVHHENYFPGWILVDLDMWLLHCCHLMPPIIPFDEILTPLSFDSYRVIHIS
jgi:ABC-type multidrug transport system fused ATPase/permease subunit